MGPCLALAGWSCLLGGKLVGGKTARRVFFRILSRCLLSLFSTLDAQHEMAAVIRQSTRLAKHSFRFASNAPIAVAADLPRVGPYDGVPFSASPEDTTKGELGQVELPNMQEHWTEEMTIVSRFVWLPEGRRNESDCRELLKVLQEDEELEESLGEQAIIGLLY